jgi:nicotinamidase-related amidase
MVAQKVLCSQEKGSDVLSNTRRQTMSKQLIISASDTSVMILLNDPTIAFGPEGGLPVDGAMDIVRPILQLYAGFGKERSVFVYDAHEHDLEAGRGHICMAESFVGADAFTRLTPELVAGWEEDNLHPGAGFTLRYLRNVYVPGVIANTGFPQTLWPVHGVKDTQETLILPGLEHLTFALALPKGEDPYTDSHSAAYDAIGRSTGLVEWLHARGVKIIVLVGLERWICDAYSGCDLADDGFEVYMVWEGTAELASHDPSYVEAMKAKLSKAGVKFIHLEDIEFVD